MQERTWRWRSPKAWLMFAVILAAFWGGAYLVSGTVRTANVLSMIFLLIGVAGALIT